MVSHISALERNLSISDFAGGRFVVWYKLLICMESKHKGNLQFFGEFVIVETGPEFDSGFLYFPMFAGIVACQALRIFRHLINHKFTVLITKTARNS